MIPASYCLGRPHPVRIPSAHATTSPESVPASLEVYAISDLHTDYEDNLRWIADSMPEKSRASHGSSTALDSPTTDCMMARLSTAGRDDKSGEVCHRVLIVAGDISDDMTTIE